MPTPVNTAEGGANAVVGLLEVKNIRKHFGGVAALSGANFSIDAGEVCGLLGANGSGKTTLSRIIAGLYLADEGEIVFEGQRVEIRSAIQAQRLGIAMAHQNLSLVGEMTVWENVCLGNESMKGLTIDRAKCVAEAKKALLSFGMDSLAGRLVGALSPSQKQLVEICKALSRSPKLLILDEPTASLEFAQVKMLFDVIAARKQEGMAIVFISHRIWEVMQICAKVVVLRNGESVSDIDVRNIDAQDQRKTILMAITGKEEEEGAVRERHIKKGENVLRLENVGLRGVLDDVSFDVAEGEIVGISGLQGMGQEELLLVLSGHIQKTSGEISFRGSPAKWRTAKQAISSGIVLVPGDRQKEGLFLDHAVLDNLMFPEYSRSRSPLVLNSRKLRKTAGSLIDKLSLSPKNPDLAANNLSGGNQQKVVVGKWINQAPEVLLMSDPAKGIDVEARSEMYEICKTLAEEGKSIILYASDNHELIDICDRVLVMFEGRIVETIDRQGLSEERLMEAALHVHDEEVSGNGVY